MVLCIVNYVLGMLTQLFLLSAEKEEHSEEQDETIGTKEEARLFLLPNASGAEEEEKAVSIKEERMLIHLRGTEEDDGHFGAKEVDEAVGMQW